MTNVADPLGLAPQQLERAGQRLQTAEPLRIDGDTQRKFIGLFGLALPVVLVIAVTIRPTSGLSTWLDSLSSYYYTSGIAVLEGLLVALALFLLAYKGYPGEYQWADKWASGLAGGAALFIALFPTYPPLLNLQPPWWTEKAGKVHYLASIVMFAMFALFSLWLFRKTDQQTMNRDKKWRNHMYLVCGLAIVGGVLWAGYRLKTGNDNILLQETIAIEAFAVSWLVKGGVLHRWLPN